MLAISEELHLGIFHGVEDIVQHYVYSPFGKITRIENAAGADITATPMMENFYTFTGREFDKESGLYYYRARYYDPALGRFLTVDPSAGNLKNPITHINKYSYVGNNSINNVDPSGMSFLKYLNPLLALDFVGSLAINAVILAVLTGTAVTIGILETVNDKGNVWDNLKHNISRNLNNGKATFFDGPDAPGSIKLLSRIYFKYDEIKTEIFDLGWKELTKIPKKCDPDERCT